MVDHPRGYGPIMRNPIGGGVPSSDLAVPKWFGQAWRLAGGFIPIVSGVPQEANTMFGAQQLIALGTPLIGWGNQSTAIYQVVTGNILASSWHSTSIRDYHFRYAGDVQRRCRKAAAGNLIVRKQVPY